MNEMLHTWLGHGGAVVFIVVLLEQAGLPIPAAPCLLAAGALCPTGEVAPLPVIGLTILACLIADTLWFLIGRRRGKSILNLLGRLSLSGNRSIERVEARFVRNGMALVAVSKFVPGLSLLVPTLAGALRIDVGRFLFFDTLGSLLYAGIYVLLGILFTEQLEAGLEMLHRFGLGALLLLALLLSAYLVCKSTCRKGGVGPGLSAKAQT